MMAQKTFTTQSTIVKEMKEMGASNHEISLIRDTTIKNAINRKRKPEDVAWAILQ